jgi:NAD(P)-dependent dehydrogenase (short-subunit alcohol dehydrogenase family)
VRADLAIEADCAALLDRAVNAVGPIGCLINNASIFEKDSAATATKESWDPTCRSICGAPFVLVQRFAASFPKGRGQRRQRHRPAGVELTGIVHPYTVSKAALWTLTRTLAWPWRRASGQRGGPGPTLPACARARSSSPPMQAVPLARKSTRRKSARPSASSLTRPRYRPNDRLDGGHIWAGCRRRTKAADE